MCCKIVPWCCNEQMVETKKEKKKRHAERVKRRSWRCLGGRCGCGCGEVGEVSEAGVRGLSDVLVPFS